MHSHQKDCKTEAMSDDYEIMTLESDSESEQDKDKRLNLLADLICAVTSNQNRRQPTLTDA
jgi:hypothetical protein